MRVMQMQKCDANMQNRNKLLQLGWFEVFIFYFTNACITAIHWHVPFFPERQ
jgi:hypothetical protein